MVRNKGKQFVSAACALLATVCLFGGCQKEPEAPDSTVPSDLPTITAPAFVSLDIQTLLTKEEALANCRPICGSGRGI